MRFLHVSKDLPAVPVHRSQRRREFPGGSIEVYPRLEAEQVAVDRIADLIRARVTESDKAVLGLATGSTPIGVYGRLVAMHRAEELSFEQVTTYNLDEYYPMSPVDPQSYRSFMDRHLFRHVGIAPNRAHVLDGTVPAETAEAHVRDFDRWIVADGGLDFQLLGLGRNGHIGFNEPTDLPVDQALALPTRLVDLHPTTRRDAIQDFGVESLVPRQALTMGIGSILAARSILVLAFGAGKAEAVARSLTGPMTAAVPGSLLQSVADRVHWFVDAEAASQLF